MKCDKTCFAASERRGREYCIATTYRTCKGPECPFYKTKVQFYKDRRRAEEINFIKGIR